MGTLKSSVVLVIIFLATSVLAQVPVADFSANQTTGCGSLVVTFTDLSTNSPNFWKWELGNGVTIQGSDKQNIVFAYSVPGVYTVTLTSTNNSGSGTKVKTGYITIFGLPQPQFSSNPTTGCVPLNVQFTDASVQGTNPSAPINSWVWDFGNGNSSNLQNPATTYGSTGNFNVTLEVKDGNNCVNTLIKNAHISVTNKPIASFTVSDSIACTPPFAVSFNHTSTGGTTFQWDFGDGNSSTSPNPSHTYTLPGTYTVKLIVGNASGCKDTLIRNNLVHIGIPPIGISVNPSAVCIGISSVFSTNTQNLVSATWDFGNGFTMAGNPVSYYYPVAGTYQVKLTVQTAGGCTRDTIKTVTVHPPSTISFIGDDLVGCIVPHTVNFSHLPNSGNFSNFYWEFGDGGFSTDPNPVHTYLSNGSYQVMVTATDANGCAVMDIKTNYIILEKPTVGFTYAVNCTDLMVEFNSNSTSISGIVNLQWDFGDGSNATGSSNPSHLYAQKDTFQVSLIVTDANGCKDTATVEVTFPLIPIAGFTTDDFLVCHGTKVCFKDTSINANSLIWYLGGVPHTNWPVFCEPIRDTGYISLKLVAYHGPCKDSIINDSVLYVLPPVAKYSADIYHSCTVPTEVFFTDSSGRPETWFWDFGDGNTSILQHPSNTYTAPGIYNVKLVVTNDDYGMSCSDSVSYDIQFSGFKRETFQTKDTVCPGDSIGFYYTTLDSYLLGGPGAIVEVYWVLENTFYHIKSDTIASPPYSGSYIVYHVYQNPGTYTELFVLVDGYGCRDTTFRTVTVLSNPKVDFETGVYGCAPAEISFLNLTTLSPLATVLSWEWDFGDGNPNSFLENPVHTYADTGKYTVKLTVTDSQGCVGMLEKLNYIDLSLPVPDFETLMTTQTPYFHCYSDTINFNNLSLDAVGFLWDFGDGNTSTGNSPWHFYKFDGDSIVEVSLTAFGRNGCEMKILKEITVVKPKAEFTSDKTTATCPPMIVSFENLSSGRKLSYLWDFGDLGSGLFNNTSTLENPVHTYAFPGTYDILLQVEDSFSCKASVLKEKFIEVHGPNGKFDFFPKDGCPVLEVGFFAYDTSNVASILWVYGDGNAGYGGMSEKYNYPEGQFTPAIQFADITGCVVTKVGTNINVYPDPLPGFSISVLDGCPELCSDFSDLSTISQGYITNWKWGFSDGDTIYSQSINKCFDNGSIDQLAKYSVSLEIISDKGCKQEKEQIDAITVYPKPMAGFDFFPKDAAAFNPEVWFYDQSAGSAFVHWNFGVERDSSTIRNPMYSYPDSGLYLVSQIVRNQFACKDTALKEVYVNGGYSIYIPNAFSPNDDGLNEVFAPIGYGLTDIRMSIYNRWGQKVYSGSGLNAGWDGTINGKKAQQGVYLYAIETRNIFSKQDEWEKYSGQVTVIR